MYWNCLSFQIVVKFYNCFLSVEKVHHIPTISNLFIVIFSIFFPVDYRSYEKRYVKISHYGAGLNQASLHFCLVYPHILCRFIIWCVHVGSFRISRGDWNLCPGGVPLSTHSSASCFDASVSDTNAAVQLHLY